jgi:hypothetical protein
VPRSKAPEAPKPPEPRVAAPQPAAATGEAVAAGPVRAEPEAVVVAPPAAPAPAEPEPEAPGDRRKHRRLRSDQTFTVTPFAGREMMAECHDVSLGGVRFGVVGYDLREDELLRVTFNLGRETVTAIGRVARLRKLDPITFEASLEFVRIDPWAERLFEELLLDCE